MAYSIWGQFYEKVFFPYMEANLSLKLLPIDFEPSEQNVDNNEYLSVHYMTGTAPSILHGFTYLLFKRQINVDINIIP